MGTLQGSKHGDTAYFYGIAVSLKRDRRLEFFHRRKIEGNDTAISGNFRQNLESGRTGPSPEFQQGFARANVGSDGRCWLLVLVAEHLAGLTREIIPVL